MFYRDNKVNKQTKNYLSIHIIRVHFIIYAIVAILCIHITLCYCKFVFRRFDVNGFGIWGCSTIQIFVKKGSDNEILKSKLIKLNQNFFDKYYLKIEPRIIVEKQTMRPNNTTMLKFIL